MAESTSRVIQYGWDKERFLQDLPPPVRRYIYRGKEQFNEILDQNMSRHSKYNPEDGVDFTQYIVFLIDPPSFQRECLDQESSHIAHLRLDYNYNTHILIVKMVNTPEHQQIIMGFASALGKCLQPMRIDLDDDGHIFQGVDIDVNEQSQKRPDWGWTPRKSSLKRPTIVFEVGISEPETKLREDARMWVDPSRGQAQVAITIKLNRSRPELKLDMWQWRDSRAQVTKHIVITQAGSQTNVSDHPLVIPFASVFKRDPESFLQSNETNIEIDKQALVKIATHAWQRQQQGF